jgi:hypothetical protein
MAGRDELAGRDVIVVQRLLKNSVKDRLGGHAYVLYSDACLQVMEVDPASQQLLEHKESIEILGELEMLGVRYRGRLGYRKGPAQKRGHSQCGGLSDRVRSRCGPSDRLGLFHLTGQAAEMARCRRSP